MVTALYYNRETDDLIETLVEVKRRILREECTLPWTDDGNIIFGTLILLYGNYGTSPGGGWFEDKKAKAEILEELDKEIQEYKEALEREKDEQPVEPTTKYNPEKLKEYMDARKEKE